MTVTEVVDGDTVDIRFQNGSTDIVRLLGVDTPETYGDTSPDEFEGVPDTEAGHECLSDWAEDASEFATQHLDDAEVQLEFDAEADRRGSFGRLLAYIVVDGENFNYDLVAEGFARVYDSTFTESDRFYDAESQAQSSEIGVWSCRSVATATPTPVDEDDGGSSGGDLAVAEVHADAEGDEYDNLNDEYVTFENTGSESLDISGWTVEDEAEHTYTVPDGTTLDAGDEITLHTGSGEDTESDLYWGSEAPIWNNGSDTVFVRDESGERVIEHEYS